MQRRATTKACRRAAQALLPAIALGFAILPGLPARAADGAGSHPAAGGPITSDLGAPKPVPTIRVPVDPSPPTYGEPRPSAASASYDGDPEYRRCIDTSAGTNVALGECGGALVKREDAKLNAAWARVYVEGAETHTKELLDEQRAWLRFKEASCQLYASGTFGREGQVLSFPVCRAGIIAQRAAALDAYGER